jgi:hypothetical protein
MHIGPVYIALVHHPVRGRDGAIITTSVTNLDVHDIARTARTYDVAGYFVVTPIEAQRALVAHTALAAIGGEPVVVTTAARSGFGAVGFADARARLQAVAPRPVVLLFGTGYGLADELIQGAEIHLAPIRAGGDYNHLAVRSAVAIIVDRLFGDEGAGAPPT